MTDASASNGEALGNDAPRLDVLTVNNIHNMDTTAISLLSADEEHRAANKRAAAAGSPEEIGRAVYIFAFATSLDTAIVPFSTISWDDRQPTRQIRPA